MRVCVVVPYDLTEEGGVKRHALDFAEALRARGDEVTVVGPRRAGAFERGSHGFGGVVNIPANGGANHMAILTPPWAVKSFFRSRDFDVVHVHEPLTPLLPYYALSFSPDAAHVCTFHMFAEREPLFSKVVRTVLGRFVFPRYERGIAVSHPASRYARLAWKKELSLIPNGVSTRTFAPGHRPARVPTTADPLRLLFVGRWEDRRKGLSRLLEAYCRLRAAGLPVVLDVVGAGAPATLHVPEGVTLHGVVPTTAELSDRYRSCDVFVSPALGQESFGMVLLEAMACGRPVVCSDIAGHRQVVDPNGARLVPPGDAEALASAIADLARDPAARREMGDLNRVRARSYDWRDLVEQVRSRYVEAIAERHGAAAALAHEPALDEPRWSVAPASATLVRSRH